MSTANLTQRITRRLKAMELVPSDQPIRILIHRKKGSRVRWSAVNAVTGEDYLTGGADIITRMHNRDWEPRQEGGWVILYPGEILPLPRPGEVYRKGVRIGK